jgi:hypothetical protein
MKMKLIYDRRSVGQYVLVSGSSPWPDFLFLFDNCGFLEVGAPSLTRKYQSQSQSHITTNSPSWCQAPIWDPRPIFLSPWNFFGQLRVLFRSALSSGRPLWREDIKVEVTLRPTVSWPVRLGVRHPSGTRDQFFFLLEFFLNSCGFVIS